LFVQRKAMGSYTFFKKYILAALQLLHVPDSNALLCSCGVCFTVNA